MKKINSFNIAVVVSLIWALFSYKLAMPWQEDLSREVGTILSIIIINGIAIVPGFINMFLVISILAERKEERDIYGISDEINDAVTVLVPIHNEEEIIYDVLRSIAQQTYKGLIKVIVINNNSVDKGVYKVKKAQRKLNLDIRLIKERKPGKNFALNTGLELVDTDYVITIDGDTILHKDAIKNIMCRMIIKGEKTFGVAGSLLAMNKKENLITKMQQLDYYMSITAIKRMQSMFESTLVCQGAFSVYRTEIVKRLGGWSDAIGEDIVLTTDGLAEGLKTYFEPKAIAYTDVPDKFRHFTKQRSRWARGMFEFLKRHNALSFPSIATKLFAMVDIMIVYIDFSYTFFWIPGLIAALVFKNFIIVGPMALLVLPCTIISFGVLAYRQIKVLKELEIEYKISKIGALIFVLCYQMIMSPTSLVGYVQEILQTKRVWE